MEAFSKVSFHFSFNTYKYLTCSTILSLSQLLYLSKTDINAALLSRLDFHIICIKILCANHVISNLLICNDTIRKELKKIFISHSI